MESNLLAQVLVQAIELAKANGGSVVIPANHDLGNLTVEFGFDVSNKENTLTITLIPGESDGTSGGIKRIK